MKTRSKILEEYANNIFGIGLAFTGLSDYQNMIEEFLQEKAEEFKKIDHHKKLKEEASFYEHPVSQDYYNHFAFEAFLREKELSIIYPNNFRASFINQVTSFVEFELREICNYYALANNTTYLVDDLKGSGLNRIALFLKRSAKIEISTLNPEWEITIQFWNLRHKLVHAQGLIKQDDLKSIDKLKQYLKIGTPFQDGLCEIIIPNKDLGIFYLKTIESLFDNLINELKIERPVI